MKRVLKEDVFGMSMVRAKHVREDVKSYIPVFVYVSHSDGGHGPRLKFNGGTSETNKSRTAPTLAFDNNGNCKVVTQSWMDKKNCPNAFDRTVVSNLSKFVNAVLPLLLLMWYERIDEAAVVEYLVQVESFEDVVSEIGVPSNVTTMKELDKYCRENNLYSFE